MNFFKWFRKSKNRPEITAEEMQQLERLKDKADKQRLLDTIAKTQAILEDTDRILSAIRVDKADSARVGRG